MLVNGRKYKIEVPFHKNIYIIKRNWVTDVYAHSFPDPLRSRLRLLL